MNIISFFLECKIHVGWLKDDNEQKMLISYHNTTQFKLLDTIWSVCWDRWRRYGVNSNSFWSFSILFIVVVYKELEYNKNIKQNNISNTNATNQFLHSSESSIFISRSSILTVTLLYFFLLGYLLEARNLSTSVLLQKYKQIQR